MDQAKYIQHLVGQKKKIRKSSAALPTPEKVKRMVELQKILAVTREKRGEHVRVWEI